MATSVYQQGGFGTAGLFPNPVSSPRDPVSTDRISPTGQPFQVFQGWNNNLTDDNFLYLGSGNWVLVATAVGSLTELTGDTGTALPVAGSIQIAGTANQITTAGAAAAITLTIPAAFIAPGSIVSTTTIASGTTLTGGTGITATAGDITATTGDLISTVGAVLAATTVTATAGDITATAGNLVSSAGSVAAATTVTATLGAITATNGNLVLGTAGNKLNITTGANASVGSGTLVAGTLTVATTAVTSSSIIILTRQSVGSTGANDLGILSVGTIVDATSFVMDAWTVTDATTLQPDDVSIVGWMIIN